MDNQQLLSLLQLTSPALPLGAYSYSEALENLVETQKINNEKQLECWLQQELKYGAIRIESAIIFRAYKCVINRDLSNLNYWNHWLSASKETVELRQQSWQIGNSLKRLLMQLENPTLTSTLPTVAECSQAIEQNCNYAIAFAMAVAVWQIPPDSALLGYLHSWATNLITAGVKLIPLGQTSGQKILQKINLQIATVVEEIKVIKDEDLGSCSWGLSLASMNHEVQYTRLFRS